MEKKTAIVTGGASGIGLQTAIQLKSEGNNVIIFDCCPAVYSTAKKYDFDAWRVDISDHKAVHSVCDEVWKKYNSVEMLCHVAAVGATKTLLETTPEYWQRIMDIDLSGAFYISREYALRMKQKGGAVVHVASDRAIVGTPGSFAYNSAKGGLVSMSRTMAIELAQYNIRVNCVCPAATDTPMLRHDLSCYGELDKQLEMVNAKFPVGRMATVEEVANVIVFLLSDQASFMTASAIPVDGGFTHI